MAGGKTPKPKLSEGSALYYREKCVCGAEVEFEAKSAMAYDKVILRWDKQHFGHKQIAAAVTEQKVYPVKDVEPVISNPSPGAIFTEKMVSAATEIEKSFFKKPKKKPTLVPKKKRPSVVEIEEAQRVAWNAKGRWEQERIRVLQAYSLGTINQDEQRRQMDRIDQEEIADERRQQKQKTGNDGGETAT